MENTIQDKQEELDELRKNLRNMNDAPGGKEVWAVRKHLTGTGDVYYTIRDKFGNICNGGFWHVPTRKHGEN